MDEHPIPNSVVKQTLCAVADALDALDGFVQKAKRRGSSEDTARAQRIHESVSRVRDVLAPWDRT